MHFFYQLGDQEAIQAGLLRAGQPQAIGERGVRAYEGPETERLEAVLVPFRAPGGLETVLLGRPGVEMRVNGKRVRARLQVLQDRDVLQLGEMNLWYSQISPPLVLPTGAPGAQCLCGENITVGDPAVECGACGGLFHPDCWDSEATCPWCDQPTAFDQAWPWVPEGFST